MAGEASGVWRAEEGQHGKYPSVRGGVRLEAQLLEDLSGVGLDRPLGDEQGRSRTRLGRSGEARPPGWRRRSGSAGRRQTLRRCGSAACGCPRRPPPAAPAGPSAGARPGPRPGPRPRSRRHGATDRFVDHQNREASTVGCSCCPSTQPSWTTSATRCFVSTTIPQLPNHAVVDIRPGDQAAATKVETWLQAYAASRDPELRERIILAYLGLADRLASRYRTSRGTTPEDLRQTARAGLIAAVDRYDPDFGTPFVAYAVACVVGELKRYLRDTSWRLHAPPAQGARSAAVPGGRRGAPAPGPLTHHRRTRPAPGAGGGGGDGRVGGGGQPA